MGYKKVKHLGYRCIGPTITPQKIDNFKIELKSNPRFVNAKKLLKVLTGKSRLDILYLLTREQELCVCDMADILDTSVSAISHQLRLLRDHHLVKTKKDSKTVYYSLNNGKAIKQFLYNSSN